MCISPFVSIEVQPPAEPALMMMPDVVPLDVVTVPVSFMQALANERVAHLRRRTERRLVRRKLMRRIALKKTILMVFALVLFFWLNLEVAPICAKCDPVKWKTTSGFRCTPCTEEQKTSFKMFTFLGSLWQVIGLMALVGNRRFLLLFYLIVFLAWTIDLLNRVKSPTGRDALLMVSSKKPLLDYRWEGHLIVLPVIFLLCTQIYDLFRLRKCELAWGRRPGLFDVEVHLKRILQGARGVLDRQLGIDGQQPVAEEEAAEAANEGV